MGFRRLLASVRGMVIDSFGRSGERHSVSLYCKFASVFVNNKYMGVVHST